MSYKHIEIFQGPTKFNLYGAINLMHRNNCIYNRKYNGKSKQLL